MQENSKQRGLVTDAPGARDCRVGELEAALPLAALRELERQDPEQARALGAVVRAYDFERPLEDRDALDVYGSGAARAAPVVRESQRG